MPKGAEREDTKAKWKLVLGDQEFVRQSSSDTVIAETLIILTLNLFDDSLLNFATCRYILLNILISLTT
jgi:hypothetical protein